jgi:hypothetical protein
MYDLQWVIDEIKTNSGFTVKWAMNRQPVLQEIKELPTVFIGYLDLERSLEEPSAPEIFEQQDSDLVFRFETQLVVGLSDFPVAWRALFKTISGKNLAPLEENFSAITYHQGGPLDVESNRIRWVDRWRLNYPISYRF